MARDRFEAAVREGPDRVAVAAGGQSLTYRQLDERAEQLAAVLHPLGIGPDSVVAVYLPGSIDRVVALIAALKAGAGYCPIDPTLPADRIRFILTDSGARVCLTRTEFAPRLTEGDPVAILVDQPLPGPARSAEPHRRAGPADLAYLVYTSGSTGQPKGVEVSHQALANLIVSWVSAFHVTPADRASPVCGPGFDANVAEIWPYLCTGASLHLPDDQTRLSPSRLVAWWADQRITLSIAPTPMAEAAIAESWPPHPSLRILFTGGDKLRRRPPIGWPVRFENQYGPSEATVLVTSGPVEPDDGTHAEPPNIGRAFGNAELHVLDTDGHPVAVGEPGELVIGGPVLARGYRNRPDLTAERFIPDPFSRRPGARLYRTGDRVRLLPDGTYEFLGRLDDQVKLRGYRIELGEIETVLRRSAGVATAVATLREDEPGRPRLVAYIVPKREVVPDPDAIRLDLAAALPAYMVPAAIVPIDAVPLTPNGKPDRAVLPPPAAEHFLRAAYEPPRSDVERHLVRIWCEELAVPGIGIRDRFLDLGGHSLLALAILARIRNDLGVDLALATFLGCPDIASLAARLETEAHQPNAEPDDQPADWEPYRDPGLERSLGLSPVYRFPASAGQRGLWYIDQLGQGSAAYNLSSAMEVLGRLDHAALDGAVSDLLQRHAALRTIIRSVDGEPCQIVLPTTRTEVRHHLTGNAREGDLDTWIRTVAQHERRRPFDLAQGPLFRVDLFQLAPDHHVLLLTLHHTITDGRSSEIILEDLGAFYRARVAGRAPDLPPAGRRYPDWTLAMARRIETPAVAAQADYWLDHLRGLVPLELPLDRPRPSVFDFAGDLVRVELPLEAARRVAAIGRAAAATPFAAFLAAYSTVLHRFTGQTSLAIGTPTAGRNLRGSERTVGFLVNTVVLRLDLADGPTFVDLVRRASGETLSAAGNAEFPFDRVVRRLNLPNDPSRNPVFQTLFALHHGLSPLPDLGDVELRRIEPGRMASQFDLTLTITDTGDRWIAEFEYATALFDRSTIARIAGHFVEALVELGASPDTRLPNLPLMPAAERTEILDTFNATERDYPRESTLADLLAAQAERTPAAEAVRFEGASLSFAELHGRARHLAARLRAMGAGPGTRVAVCAERSFDLVVALLGVLESGAAYVPLDPDYPTERLRFMLDDAAPPILLTQTPLLQLVGDFPGQTICLDQDGGLPPSEARERTPPPLGPDDPAYMIYTSGSTGRPKGAMNSHRGIVNRLLWMQEAYALTPGDTVLQKTPFSFDVSVWEFFWPLLTGARLVLARPGGHRDPAYLTQVIQAERITVLHFVPSMLRAFLSDPAARSCPTLRDVICSGEALPADLVRLFFDTIPARLHNLYGPTEAAVDVTAWTCGRNDGDTVPIGRPIANTQTYVLDSDGRPTPIGVAGELFLGGVQVGLGYWRRPELTAERFVPDPFRPGQRLYRTGDRARWRADGALEFLGRLDFQVKLRGLRIELGEIEAALAQLPGVTGTTVLLREDRIGDQRLVAYYTGGADEAVLRAALARALPDYMVPSHFVALPAFPVTPNGKLDRRALPAPTAPAASHEDRPRTAREQLVARFMAEELGVAEVGRNDDFFRLGGHSLLAARLLGRIREATSSELTLRSLFDGATPAAIAAHISDGALQANTAPITLNGAGHRPPLAFLHGDFGGGGLYCRQLAHLLGSDQPLIILSVPRADSESTATLENAAACVIRQLRAVQPSGPYRLGGWCNGGLVAWEMARQLTESGDHVDLVFLIDSDAQNAHLPWARPVIELLDRLLPRPPLEALERRARVMLRLRYFKARLASLKDTPIRDLLSFVPGFLARKARRVAWLVGFRRIGSAPTPISFAAEGSVEWRDSMRLSSRAAAAYFPPELRVPLSLVLTAPPPEFTVLDDTLGWKFLAPDATFTRLACNHMEAVATALPETAHALRMALEGADGP